MKLTTKNKRVPEYLFKDWVLDSYLEVFFCYYCQELKDRGYIIDFSPHVNKWEISEKVTIPYLKQLKTKVVEKELFLLHPSSYTCDFSIKWAEKAVGVFVLDPSKPVKDVSKIPFRLGRNDGSLVSFVEIKSTNESTTSSSISFTVFQKIVMKYHNCFVQKIQPFSLNLSQAKKTLFYQTFYPEAVIKSQVYRVKYGKYKPGDSKIKHKYLTCEEFLKLNINDTKARHTYTTRGR